MSKNLIDIHKLCDIEIIDIISSNPSLLSLFEMTKERRVTALKSDGNILAKIPKSIQTKDECLIAISNAPQALAYVSKKIIDFELCKIAVSIDGLTIRYVPQSILCQELIDIAIMQNGCAIKYLDNLNYEICMKAVISNFQAIEFVPDNILNKEMVNTAIESDIGVLPLLSEEYLTKDLCIDYLQYLMKKGESGYSLYEKIKKFPQNVRNDKEIVKLKKQLNIKRISKKYFDNESKQFYAVEERSWFPYVKKYCFETFDEFYNFVEGNLYGTEFNNFDFSKVEIKKYTIPLEFLPTELLISKGMYDDSFYKNSVGFDVLLEKQQSEKNEIVKAESILHTDDFGNIFCFNSSFSKIFYISDIHLNHKIKKKFPHFASKYDINNFINEIVDKMVKNVEIDRNDYILIAGDISFDFGVSELFYRALSYKTNCRNIVVVLGNHELWDKCNNVDKIIEKYRAMLKKLGIVFLQNELLLSNGNRFDDVALNYKHRHIVVSEEEILQSSSEELKNICLKNQICIFGGLGFSGYCNNFNANNNIYRNTIKNLDDDIEQTLKFENIYNKLKESLCDEKIIVLTHTPKNNWSQENFVKNWIYVNGHTHHNEYCCDNEKTIYSDNQIGYNSSSIYLKHFVISSEYDIFRNYRDGIYEISLSQYADFNRGKGVKSSFNRYDGNVYMLKRDSIYCFLFKTVNENLYLLNGGVLNKLEKQEIEYYYDGMLRYSYLVKKAFSGYYDALFKISKFIKIIGGTGKIHGCIVDVDLYNHLYVNINDGSIIPYFALSVCDKYTYKSLESLLKHNRKDLLENYKKLKLGSTTLNEKTILPKKEEVIMVNETEMYKPSKAMKKIQYLLESNVIRIWNDELFDFEDKLKIK